MTTSAVYEIPKAIVDHLLVVMRDELDAWDETRAGLVRQGLLQDSPLKAGINVLVHYNDPDDDKNWRHSIADGGIGSMAGIRVPVYEIGGGQMWWRRYKIQLTLFMKPGTTREKAGEVSNIILTRAEQAILEAQLPTQPDSFGEVPIQTYIHSSTNVAGGGPGQFIFYGNIWAQVLTERF